MGRLVLLYFAVAVVVAGCAPLQEPRAFGITMVEETTCIGQGGRIVIGPDGPMCNR